MKGIYTVLINCFITVNVFAQQPVLLKDISKVYLSSSSPSAAGDYTLVNGITFFTADDGVHGKELWKTDGTGPGTVMVKDIHPGQPTSIPSNLTNVNGTLFFSAMSDYTTGLELWKTDGTEAGTVMVKDISQSGGSDPAFLTNLNGILFFKAGNPGTGTELWKSDGTEAGTVIVKDILPGSNTSSPRNLLNVNGTLFFAALSPGGNASNFQLWKSDGTGPGTVLVKDVTLQTFSIGSTTEMANVNGTLFFRATDEINGNELWKSDGTTTGTVMVKNINPSGESAPSQFTAVGTLLYFTAADGTEGSTGRLWKSDGTAEGTTIVVDIDGHRLSASPLANFNGTLFFGGNNGGNSGTELWKSDGTAGGTTLVKDIVPGIGNSAPFWLTPVNGMLFFTTSSGTVGLWKTDGTAEGTINIKPGTSNQILSPANLYSDSTRLYFTNPANSLIAEPWISDGTDDGTVMLKDVNNTTAGSNPHSFIQAGEVAFFTADDGIHGRELWKTDGTSEGTTLVKDIWANGSSDPGYLAEMNGSLFFRAQIAVENWKLFKSDGTTAGTVRLDNTDSTIMYSNEGSLVNVNGTLFFLLNGALWKSDGTNAGTVLVTDNVPGIYSFSAKNTANVNGVLFFLVWDGTGGIPGIVLWKSDGTAAGTTAVKNIGPAQLNANLINLISFGDRLFFTANDGVHGEELWVSDGTAAGTAIFMEIIPGAVSSFPRNLKVIGSNLYFSANNGANPFSGMYKTDGTVSGTIEITNADGNRFGTNHEEFAGVDSTVFFTTATAANGQELWKVNAAGHVASLVKDIYPGTSALDPRPVYLTSANGILFFNATNPLVGEELWKSDGTEAGTVPMDIVPGPLRSSAPASLAAFKNSLLFAATDPVNGTELWILKMEPFIWTGNISTAWENAGNWSTNEVPTSSSVVFIPAGKPNYPVVSVSTSVRSITCAEGSSVTIASGATLELVK